MNNNNNDTNNKKYCNCHIKKPLDIIEKEEIRNLILGQTNPYKQATKMNDNIDGFELILNQPYNQVWSGNDFFRDKKYLENKLFYESPYKYMANK
jgi:hypothetical protein